MTIIDICSLEHTLNEQQQWHKRVQIYNTKKKQQARLMNDYINSLTILMSTQNELNQQIQNSAKLITILRY